MPEDGNAVQGIVLLRISMTAGRVIHLIVAFIVFKKVFKECL
jgi:hypothetical protein